MLISKALNWAYRSIVVSVEQQKIRIFNDVSPCFVYMRQGWAALEMDVKENERLDGDKMWKDQISRKLHLLSFINEKCFDLIRRRKIVIVSE